MRIDVIVPTYNNGEVLVGALSALAEQVVPAGWIPRVIVSDDGSDASPESVVSGTKWPDPWLAPVVLCGRHKGVAPARNAAIKKSDADILFFLGADIFLRPGALAAHCTLYEEEGVDAGLGMVVWDPRIRPTALMEWMVHGGPQNDFDALLGVQMGDIRTHWYGSHLSCRRSIAQQELFPEAYSSYGWEDLDMGRALFDKGVTLRVVHSAVGLHHHRYTASAIQKRQYYVGANARIYQNRYPNASILPSPSWMRVVKVLMYRFLGIRPVVWWLVAWVGQMYAIPRLFLYATAAEFWYGWYKEGAGKR